ncbi:MAG: DUF2158 domain-containing protein [Alphaproteobacteria bacterium]|nr:DUF2158 domain-containing protein [Alphaproteobacteria bacterium]
MEEIKPGDIVMLKSGGPLMTVVEIENDKSARCVWFPKGAGEKLIGDVFMLHILAKDR